MTFTSRTMAYAGGSALALAAVILVTVLRDKPAAGAADNSPTYSPRATSTRPSATAPVRRGRRYFQEPTDAVWKRTAATLSPEQARKMLDQDKLEITNLDLRAERAWNIINQLCRNGHSREAWNLIETAPGAVRENGLGGFFRDADLPAAELISMMITLENRERSSAYYNYWNRFTPEEFAKLDLSRFPMRNAIESDALRRSMEEMLGDVFNPNNPDASKWVRHDLIDKALQQANQGTMDYNSISGLLEKDPSKDGFTYWEVLKGATPEIRANELLGTRNFDGTDSKVIRAMTIQDPARTMELTLTPGSHEANYIHIAMRQWLEKDFGNAQAWVDQHYANFTPDQQERTAVAFVRAQVTRGEYDSAAEWATKVTSPKWKESIGYFEGQIRKNRPQPPPAN